MCAFSLIISLLLDADCNSCNVHLVAAFKPYKCEECGKAFRWLGNLNLHLATHNPEALHKCDLDGCTRVREARARARAYSITWVKVARIRKSCLPGQQGVKKRQQK